MGLLTAWENIVDLHETIQFVDKHNNTDDGANELSINCNPGDNTVSYDD